MRRALILGFTVIWCGTAGAQATGTSTRQAAGASDAAIKTLVDSYIKATLAGDVKGIAALYTEDAVEMPPNAPSVNGRAAIEQYYTKVLSGSKVTNFTVTRVESRVTGDIGYEVGTYQESVTPASAGAAPVRDTGKYVIIVKRAAGAWKVAYAIYNSDQPPPPTR